MEDAARRQPTQTVVALFDDQIDAEHALAMLRKTSRAASNVSVLARDRRVSGDDAESPLDVTRAVMDTALSTVSNWLTGLAALMVPDQGHFLAAGPIGVVLAKIRPATPAGGGTPDQSAPEPVGSVGLALERFGFRPSEAHYLEQRVAAGSAMIAVTASTDDQVSATLRAFADYNAVFIGKAETPGEVVAEAERGLVNPLAVRSTEVVVADIVAPLRHTSSNDRIEGLAPRLTGSEVVDARGERIGEIEDVLIDAVNDRLIRYLIVGQGGVLGIGRRRFAVPADALDLEESPVRIRRAADALGGAPAYDSGVPFSRKDEEAVHRFFSTRPYWGK